MCSEEREREREEGEEREREGNDDATISAIHTYPDNNLETYCYHW